MFNSDENTRIINAERKEQLIEARNAQLGKIQTLEFLLNLLKNANARDFNCADTERIEEAIKKLRFQDFLQLDDSSYTLDLQECKIISLSYTERKAARTYVIEQASKALDPILEFIHKMKMETPSISDSTNRKSRLAELEKKRRDLQLKLAEAKQKKCVLLKSAADIKLGSSLKNELELTLSDINLAHGKALTLQRFILDTLFSAKYSRTDRPITAKAIKEAELFVNEALNVDVENFA